MSVAAGEAADALAASVELLWRDPSARSRNRNFDRFSDPHSAHARRIVLYLLMLRSEMERLPCGAVRACRGQFARGTVRLAYHDPTLGLRRTVFLTEHEVGLLTDVPVIREKVVWDSQELPG